MLAHRSPTSGTLGDEMTTISTGRVQKYASTAFQCSSPQGPGNVPFTHHSLVIWPYPTLPEWKEHRALTLSSLKGSQPNSPLWFSVWSPTPPFSMEGRGYLLGFAPWPSLRRAFEKLLSLELNWSLRGVSTQRMVGDSGPFYVLTKLQILKVRLLIYLDLNFLTIQ